MSDHQEHTHHVTPIRVYVITFLLLVGLMLLTVWSSKWDLGSSVWNNLINLTIAVIKATLVVMFFMGLKYSTSLTKIFGLAGFIWLILMGITFGDYATRDWDQVNGWSGKDIGQTPAGESEMRTQLNRDQAGIKTVSPENADRGGKKPQGKEQSFD